MSFSNPQPTSSSQANANITIPKRNSNHPDHVNPLSHGERGKSVPLEERGTSSTRALPYHLPRKYHHQFQSETSHSLTSTLSQSHFFPFTLLPPLPPSSVPKSGTYLHLFLNGPPITADSTFQRDSHITRGKSVSQHCSHPDIQDILSRSLTTSRETETTSPDLIIQTLPTHQRIPPFPDTGYTNPAKCWPLKDNRSEYGNNSPRHTCLLPVFPPLHCRSDLRELTHKHHPEVAFLFAPTHKKHIPFSQLSHHERWRGP